MNSKQVRISIHAHQVLKIKSAESGVSMMELISRLIKETYEVN